MQFSTSDNCFNNLRILKTLPSRLSRMIFFEDIRLVFQKFCKLLPAKSEMIIVVLCAISILLAMTTPRFHLLIDKIVVQTFLQYFQFTVAVCAASLVLVNHQNISWLQQVHCLLLSFNRSLFFTGLPWTRILQYKIIT